LFKGKEFVFNHHLSVPFRPLIPDTEKSIGEARLDDNLIIHGDNLHALKALLPVYAGKVDCIFIDPPYNTGNENWNYNDNVNSPMMKEWLSGNPVNAEDMLRHDKWLSMMWPRLRLLHELLGEAGSIWITLDDNEIHFARAVFGEIFGEQNFVATCIWHKNYAPKNSAKYFSEDHDYLLIYAKNKEVWRPHLLQRTEEMEARYSNPDLDCRGDWKSSDMSARNYYSLGTYPITCPSGRVIDGPPPGRYWVVSPEKFEQLKADNRIWWGEHGDNIPAIKRFRFEVKPGRVPQTIWEYDEVGHTQDAKKEVLAIMNYSSADEVFITPKPVALVAKVLDIATDENSIVLDSFAGSGTTGHAVLAHNANDGGNRKFILVEGENYADTLTAERVRRVINGYSFTGTQREELLRERITFSKLKKADKLLERVQGFENLDGHRFDRIAKEVKDGELIVTGEKQIEDRTEGLDGSFTYATLGDPIELDRLLTGESLPIFEALGAVLFHMATNQAFNSEEMQVPVLEMEGHGYLGESTALHVWLIYEPDLEFLKSPSAALTLAKAQAMAELKPEKRHLVFAPARFVSQRMLDESGVHLEFAPLPFGLYRMELG
jgi:adenine-specific DNA-methyltransferase